MARPAPLLPSEPVVTSYARLFLTRDFLMSALMLELVVGSIVARCAVMVRAAFRSVTTPVVPSPAVTVLAILAAIVIAESPRVLLLHPVAFASLVPVVRIGSGKTRCQRKRTGQNTNQC